MSMVCPKCSESFEHRIQCPACSVRLFYQASARPLSAASVGRREQWQHTPYGRIFVGLLLAQGLYHGLQQLCTAGLLAVGSESSKEVWATLFGLILQQGLQGIVIFAGGALAGSGQRRGILIGTILGVLNCLILFIVDYFDARSLSRFALSSGLAPLTIVAEYGQPVLLTAFGTLGGLVGSLIWKPLPTLTLPADGAQKKIRAAVAPAARSTVLAGPVAYARVALGIAVAVAGNSWANVILKFFLDSSDGKLSISSRLQAQLVTMEICALAVLIGSCLAGATTANGLKQGLCVGVGVTGILLWLQMQSALPMADKMIYTSISTLALAVAGGWFGGHLFPPIHAGSHRKSPAPSFQ